MLREFLVYLYCIFTGKDPSFTYELPYPGGDWPALVQHFKSLKWKPYTYSDEVFIHVEEDVIKINEFYDSGFSERGTSMRYSNEVDTLIRPKDDILEITITVSRVIQYRICVIVIFFLFAVFSLFMIHSMRAYMRAEEINGNLPLMIVFFSIFLCLIPAIWLVSRWKHRQVFKQISKILKSVPQNIAT